MRMVPVVHVMVEEGDTLSRVAEVYLGDYTRFPEIARANLINNPDLLYPGQVLVIPIVEARR